MNILVRNLNREVTEKELMQLFLPFGKIRALNIVTDGETGRSKGFGFVDMPDAIEAAAAIKALNGRLIRGEKARVKITDQAYSPSQKAQGSKRPERFEYRERKSGGRRERRY
jgi:RNA recognition motif-containing protein